MKRADSSNGVFLCFFATLFYNVLWLLPAVILLVLHFVLSISLWWSAVAVALWFLYCAISACIIKFANSCQPIRDNRPENKNPYSATTEGTFGKPADDK